MRKRADTIRGKFPHVVDTSGPVVYVAEFDNGVVKVGFTEGARSRLSLLQTEARRHFGETSVVRFHVSRTHVSNYAARRAEDEAVMRVAKVAEPAGEHLAEFFRGVTFEDAVRIVDEASERHWGRQFNEPVPA